jgi:hypothetical protein
MHRLARFLFPWGLAALVSVAAAQGMARAQCQDATVRIASHGCSGTSIASGKGWTLILSCAHAFAGPRARAPIILDVPQTHRRSPEPSGPPRLVSLDSRADLSLILLPAGPAPAVCPPTSARPQAGDVLISAGFDRMQWPSIGAPAQVVGTRPGELLTRQRPAQGRSGGPLYHPGTDRLVGVVVGYERSSQSVGIYVHPETVREFLARRGVTVGRTGRSMSGAPGTFP